jgi:hypothetical protein
MTMLVSVDDSPELSNERLTNNYRITVDIGKT